MIPSPPVDLLPAQLAACAAIGWILGAAFVCWCDPRHSGSNKTTFIRKQK